MNKKIEEIFDLLNDFNKKHYVFSSEEDNSTIYYNTIIAGITEIILCKSVFKRNKEIVEFLSTVFGLNFPEYVTKNKMLIIGKTVKHFKDIEDIEDIKNNLNKLYEVYSKIMKDDYDNKKLSWQQVIDSIDLSR